MSRRIDRVIYILIMFSILFPLTGFPQQLNLLPILREYQINSWSLSEGVPPHLYIITQTPDGFL
ncbi:MAG: hypothetical protein ISR57_08535 [Bacteroidales bacterium]|nr:hypothetical protein [Bacteroidota bacterium]MBL6950673.1 hypothetical protein [Bacteroidales bacterium]